MAVRVLLLLVVVGILLLLLVLMVMLLGGVELVVHPFSFSPGHPLSKGVGVAVVVRPVSEKESG